MNDIGGVVTRVGDETVGEMWSLYDGRDVLNEIDPRFGDNIANHIQAVIENRRRSTSPPIPIRRATARRRRRIRTPT